jgi:branched-chain amino acid transport system permease protein
MSYFIEVLLNGVLAGAIYVLIGLAFVIVYKASRVINFALGELLMIATRLVAAGLYVFGLGSTGAILVGLLENIAAAYLDPLLSGFSLIASYLVLIVMLFVRPYGLFGEPDVERV